MSTLFIVIFVFFSVYVLDKYVEQSCCGGLKINKRNLVLTTILLTTIFYIVKTYLQKVT